jgi:hypothetical protein
MGALRRWALIGAVLVAVGLVAVAATLTNSSTSSADASAIARVLSGPVKRADTKSPRPVTRLVRSAAVATPPSNATPTLPAFVTQGLSLGYYESLYSGYIGEHVTTTVTAVNAGEVSATTTSTQASLPPGVPNQTVTGAWQCSAAGSCSHGAAGLQFWIDPNAPTGSLIGQGLPYQYFGERQISDPFDKTQYPVGWVGYTSSDGRTIFDYFFDPTTGLVIEHDEKYPGGNLQLWYTGGGPG